jgi:hypothetical protein
MRKVFRLLPVTLMLTLVLAMTTYVTAAANFQVTDLTISPESAKEGDTITISCAVKNSGDAEDSYILELKITDPELKEIKDSKELVLGPGESQTASFTITAGSPGDYIVDLNGLPGYFTVKTSFLAMFPSYLWAIIGAVIGVLFLLIIVLVVTPSRKKRPEAATTAKRAGRQGPPTTMPTPIPGPTMPSAGQPFSMPPPIPGPFPTPGPAKIPHSPYTGRAIFSVSNLTITPNQAKSGEPITIGALVTNNGTEVGKYSLVLRINGVVEGITELTLPPGGSQAATFTVIKDIGGDYHAEVDGFGGTFTIIPLIPANFSVSNLVIAPERVKQGEGTMVSAVVTNNGEISGNYSVVLKIKGTVEGVQEVQLGPGGSQRIAFNVTKETPGFYSVELEGLTGRFVVEMEWKG